MSVRTSSRRLPHQHSGSHADKTSALVVIGGKFPRDTLQYNVGGRNAPIRRRWYHFLKSALLFPGWLRRVGRRAHRFRSFLFVTRVADISVSSVATSMSCPKKEVQERYSEPDETYSLYDTIATLQNIYAPDGNKGDYPCDSCGGIQKSAHHKIYRN